MDFTPTMNNYENRKMNEYFTLGNMQNFTEDEINC